MTTNNKIKKQLTKLIFLAIAPLVALVFPFASSAAGAKLYLSPASGTYYTGQYISVNVLVDTGGSAANAFRAVLTYTSDKLEAVSVSAGGSICSLWITQKKTDLECGAITPFKGRAGKIATVTFRTFKAGDALVSIAAGNVKRADGEGTEILTSREATQLAIQDLPEGTPAVSSPTHPEQNSWYQSRKAELLWTPQGNEGFSYLLSQNPLETPDDVAEGTQTTASFENLKDGTWFFHIKAKIAGGWSTTAHFRIQVDGTAPEEFEIVSDPTEERIFRAPLLSFFTTDATSGIARYEISLDGSGFAETASPYRFSRIRSGNRTATVRAYDWAGNYREASITLSVIGVPSPTITNPRNGDAISLFAPLGAKALALAPGKIEFSLDGQVIGAADAAGQGEFEYIHRKFIFPGKHKLSAAYINPDGIESEPAEVEFNVTPWSAYLLGITIPGYLFYPLLLASLILLAWLIKRWWKKIKRKKKDKKPEIKETKIKEEGNRP